MQVVLHLGAHCTDEDRLPACLLKNADAFRERGIAVPQPKRYRRLLRDTVHAMKSGEPTTESAEVLVDAMLDDDLGQIDRLILSHQHFLSAQRTALSRGVLYNAAERKLQDFGRLFPEDEVELFLGIRNPATFLPALFEASKTETFIDFMDGADPRDIHWSHLVRRIREAVPDMAMTVWCNEDTPLIWAQIIREMAGLDPNEKIRGGFDLLAEIMTKEGMQRFRAYLKSHPVMTEVQKRRVIAAFLDKFAIEDEVEQELDLPGWTDTLIDTLTETYEEDVYEISRIQGVTLITP